MPDNLKEGTCTIIPLMEGTGGLGVNLTLPASQPVVTNGPVTEWKVKKVDGKNDVYLLSVGGYGFTFYEGNIVTASILEEQSQEWYITYQSAQDAYLIQDRYGSGLGWTIPIGETSESIRMAPIIAPPVYPPRFAPMYLFRFEFSD